MFFWRIMSFHFIHLPSNFRQFYSFFKSHYATTERSEANHSAVQVRCQCSIHVIYAHFHSSKLFNSYLEATSCIMRWSIQKSSLMCLMASIFNTCNIQSWLNNVLFKHPVALTLQFHTYIHTYIHYNLKHNILFSASYTSYITMTCSGCIPATIK
jgi:hypothetical protein